MGKEEKDNSKKKDYHFIKRIHASIKEDNKAVYRLYFVLRLLVIVVMIRSIFLKNYESTAVCVLTLLLLLVPSILEGVLKVKIPPLLEGILYCFIFAAEILGELGNYYTKIPIWDTMLHTINGFLFAAVGFVTVDLLNRNSKNFKLSPLYLTMVAFCFSMTIGVLWEFFEFGADMFLGKDMQKDFVIESFQSTKMDPTQSQIPFRIKDIVKTEITTASDEVYVVEGGFLDVGLRDTMKDLLVNFVGAVVFCIFGHIYLKADSGKKSIATTVVEGLRIHRVENSDDSDDPDDSGHPDDPGR